MSRAVTLKMVAREAGLSPSSVSRILNRQPDVRFRDETRRHVESIAARLGYQANGMARALRKGRSRRIGLLLPTGSYIFTLDYFLKLMRGMMDEMSQGEYSLLMNLAPGDERDDRYREHLMALVAGGEVEGLILWTYSAVYRQVGPGHAPVLICGNPAPKEISHVDCDNHEGGRLAAGHLLSLGHRRILRLGFDRSDSARERMKGFKAECVKAGFPAPSALEGEADFTREGGRKAVSTALDQGLEFTAVFCANDSCALGAMDELRARGREVPTDVSVVGFDDAPEAENAGLTTIRQPVYEVGRRAARALVEIIESGRETPLHVDLPVELVLRASTASPRSGREA